MMTQHAPAGGYDFIEKRLYRRGVWLCMNGFATKDFKENDRTVLLTGTEGSEINVARKLGFKKIVAVNSNPAIVATVKRRFPFVETKGVQLSEAMLRLPEASVRFVNADFCSQASDSMARELFRVVRASSWHRVGFLAVTMLRGREPSSWDITGELEDGRFMPKLKTIRLPESRADFSRLMFVACGISYSSCPSLLGYGIYPSTNGQSFLWSVWMLEFPWRLDPFSTSKERSWTYHRMRPLFDWNWRIDIVNSQRCDMPTWWNEKLDGYRPQIILD